MSNNNSFEVVDDEDGLFKTNSLQQNSEPVTYVDSTTVDSTTVDSSDVNTKDEIQPVEQTKTEPNGLNFSTTDKNNSLDERIKEYVELYSPTLYILTPCYASLCYVNYILCMMATKELCEKYNIGFKVEFCRNDSLVSRARNNLVAKAMNDPKMTHMIFIDADITWQPVDILKLIVANKPIVGGLYPLKHYNWNKLIKDNKDPNNTNPVQTLINKKNQSQFKSVIDDERMIQHNLLSYNVNYLSNTISIENNITRVRHLATGFMMMKRGMIEKMSKAFPSTKYKDDVGFLSGTENDFAYALFDCGVEDGHYYSEDWLFCHRWTKMGGEIFIDISIALTHTGIEDYKGNYLASLL